MPLYPGHRTSCENVLYSEECAGGLIAREMVTAVDGSHPSGDLNLVQVVFERLRAQRKVGKAVHQVI